MMQRSAASASPRRTCRAGRCAPERLTWTARPEGQALRALRGLRKTQGHRACHLGSRRALGPKKHLERGGNRMLEPRNGGVRAFGDRPRMREQRAI